MFYNRPRRSRSIPAVLWRRGRWLEIPLYYVLRTSDLAREGMDHGGSFRFADHIYLNRASGRGRLGRFIDRQMLHLPAVRSFRNRYLEARQSVFDFLRTRGHSRQGVDLLSVPSGIPRELVEAACQYRDAGGSLESVRLHALDLDPAVLGAAEELASAHDVRLRVHLGDIFDPAVYAGGFDFITSTGLGEFLADEEMARFFAILYEHLRPQGVFVTSSMRRRRLSDYLLRLAELNICYRGTGEVARLAALAGFTKVEASEDELGIQCFLRACR